MRDGVTMSTYLNDLNSIVSQLNGQAIEVNDSLKAFFLLITLPKSWDTFKMTISDTLNIDGLSLAMVESNLV